MQSPASITEKSTFGWGVLVLLLGVAGLAASAQVRISNHEEELRAHAAKLDANTEQHTQFSLGIQANSQHWETAQETLVRIEHKIDDQGERGVRPAKGHQ